ncbi:DUF3153 domain-containing protein [Oscillatoria sp. FACHB-1406]|uniref:DUF3153 domain-containing protein n=1 Tax=Oscillatoria sp. FACHB-1406 TaxID=2692846 RepID=UPI00168406ED|nr:DUF3153 domain-containing protein [Oscillatoria sp. FACHB-1406]MBD2578352.1 DUF3153 domain-containing protein [Oscillatoria sp. FACHB-1406]
MTVRYPRRRWRFSPARLFFFAFIAFSALFLSGCVRYDVGINFKGQFQGAIVQHIRLSEQLASFNQLEAQKWLKSFDSRASKLQGKTQHLSDREILVTIPFANGDELVEKFNQFFNPTQQPVTAKAENNSSLSPIPVQSQLYLKQRNWVLFERERIQLTVDLRGLGVTSEEGPLIVSPDSLVNLELALNTPWGAKNVTHEEVGIAPPARTEGTQLIWQLQPGQVNLLDAIFWVPSYLAWGAIAIALLVSFGYFLKYKRIPLLP